MSSSWHDTNGAGDPWAVREKHLEADGAWRVSNHVRERVPHIWGIRCLSLPEAWRLTESSLSVRWVFPYLWQSEPQSSSQSALEIPGEDDSEPSIGSRVIQSTVLVILVSGRYLGKSWLMRKSPRVIDDARIIFFPPLLASPSEWPFTGAVFSPHMEAKNVTQQVLTLDLSWEKVKTWNKWNSLCLQLSFKGLVP